jgi:hypothetical protein
MTVERSYPETGQRRRETSTKSGQKRRIALDPYTAEMLTAYRAQGESDCTALGITLPATRSCSPAPPTRSDVVRLRGRAI